MSNEELKRKLAFEHADRAIREQNCSAYALLVGAFQRGWTAAEANRNPGPFVSAADSLIDAKEVYELKKRIVGLEADRDFWMKKCTAKE